MKVLAIETSTLTGSVALVEEERLLGEMTLSVSVQHSERLMPAIADLLTHSGVPLASVDLFAVSAGPGSFTGLRIGVACAQGLAASIGKPLVGVPTLQALAMNGLHFPGLVVPLLNAYRGEVYRGLYQKVPGTFWSMEGLAEDRVCKISELIDELGSRKERTLLLGNGVEIIGEGPLQTLDGAVMAPMTLNNPRASNVALLASSLNQKVPGTFWLGREVVLPHYLRSPG